MSYLLLSVEQIETLHDLVLNPVELPGKALNKSLEGALARVDNRLVYGMIEDVFDLAAIRLAQRLSDAGEMADWLRAQAGA